MANLMMKCPVKNTYVPTGVGMDAISYQSSKLSNNTSDCSACGGSHVWGEVETMLDN
jgi:hypothetical protein